MTFALKRGDTRRVLEVVMKGPSGAPVDLTGATVRFYMRPKHGGANKVDGALSTVADAVGGKVWYVWTAADVDTVEHYIAQFTVTFPDGKRDSYPSDTFIEVDVIHNLA